MARARAVSGLSEQDPYAHAAARVVAVRAAELFEHTAGVLDVEDIERVHDMRVATRRLRAALEVFEPCFPRKAFKAALREVKRLADALGERRDRDVTIAALDEFAAALEHSEGTGVKSLIGSLRAEQAAANEALAAHVSEERLAALRERLVRLARDAEARLSASADMREADDTPQAGTAASNGAGLA